MEQLEKFVNSLMSARSNMEGRVELAENGVGPIIDTIKTPADYQDAGEHEKMVVMRETKRGVSLTFSNH